ncbi:MAG: hypothetical protein AAFQ82_28100 [Myxococcota bacterium]
MSALDTALSLGYVPEERELCGLSQHFAGAGTPDRLKTLEKLIETQASIAPDTAVRLLKSFRSSGTNTMLAALDILLPKFSLESNELISFRRAMGVQGYGRSFNETFLARLVSVTPRVAPHAAKTVLNGFSKADRPAAA